MPVTMSALPGVAIITQPTHGDERGFFRQTFVLGELSEQLGRTPVFRQANHARSAPGVLRGIHAEPWDKMVYVARGRVLAVLVDLRPDSPAFGEHLAIELGDGTERARVFVPDGVGNSYCVLGDDPADYLYDVTAEYRPGVDKRAVAWDDPDLAIDWPLEDPVLSAEDRAAPTLRERYPDHPRFAPTQEHV